MVKQFQNYDFFLKNMPETVLCMAYYYTALVFLADLVGRFSFKVFLT